MATPPVPRHPNLSNLLHTILKNFTYTSNNKQYFYVGGSNAKSEWTSKILKYIDTVRGGSNGELLNTLHDFKHLQEFLGEHNLYRFSQPINVFNTSNYYTYFQYISQLSNLEGGNDADIVLAQLALIIKKYKPSDLDSGGSKQGNISEFLFTVIMDEITRVLSQPENGHLLQELFRFLQDKKHHYVNTRTLAQGGCNKYIGWKPPTGPERTEWHNCKSRKVKEISNILDGIVELDVNDGYHLHPTGQEDPHTGEKYHVNPEGYQVNTEGFQVNTEDPHTGEKYHVNPEGYQVNTEDPHTGEKYHVNPEETHHAKEGHISILPQTQVLREPFVRDMILYYINKKNHSNDFNFISLEAFIQSYSKKCWDSTTANPTNVETLTSTPDTSTQYGHILLAYLRGAFPDQKELYQIWSKGCFHFQFKNLPVISYDRRQQRFKVYGAKGALEKQDPVNNIYHIHQAEMNSLQQSVVIQPMART